MSAVADDAPTLLHKWRLMQHIMADPDLSELQRRVAFRLLDLYDAKRGCAWPSRSTLAKNLGVSSRGVQKATVELVAAGWFVVELGGGGPKDPNRYLPAWDRAEPCEWPSKEVAPSTNRGSPLRQSVSTNSAALSMNSGTAKGELASTLSTNPGSPNPSYEHAYVEHAYVEHAAASPLAAPQRDDFDSMFDRAFASVSRRDPHSLGSEWADKFFASVRETLEPEQDQPPIARQVVPFPSPKPAVTPEQVEAETERRRLKLEAEAAEREKAVAAAKAKEDAEKLKREKRSLVRSAMMAMVPRDELDRITPLVPSDACDRLYPLLKDGQPADAEVQAVIDKIRAHRAHVAKIMAGGRD